MKRLVVSLLACVLLLGSTAFGQVCDLTGRRIFVDPGHGGTDPGAIGPTGLQEKEVTLDVGLRLREWLERFGATVAMSRERDVFIPLTDRADLANSFGAHRFISVHVNSFTDPSANGTEVYVVPNPREVTSNLGQSTLKHLLLSLGLRNRGLRFASFVVLVRTSMPAALSESAFISNPLEESLLRDPEVRGRIAEAHAYAMCRSILAFDETDGESDFDQVVSETQPPHLPNPDRGRLKLIGVIDGGKRFAGPKFSPDGSLLAFGGAGYKGLYVADVTNLRPQQLTAESGAGFDFSWSPDGRAIAFAPREGTAYAVKVVTLPRQRIEKLIESKNPVRPEYQPGGDLIIVNADTARLLKRLPESGGRMPDPPAVVTYIRDGQVWAEINGETTRVTDDELRYTDQKLSPTKDKVLVTGSNKDGSFLLAIDLETKAVHDLSLLGVGRSGAHNLGYEGTWSPDGRRVLFSLTRDDGHTHVASDIYVVDHDGENLVRLTEDGSVKLNPSWSVRNQIAFETADGKITVAEMR